MLLIKEIKSEKSLNNNDIKAFIIDYLKINADDLLSYEIKKKSLDARKKLHYVYNIVIELKNEKRFLKRKNIEIYHKPNIQIPKVNTDIKPIIVGYGPSGIFAAYYLLDAGIKSIVFEKGSRIDKREKDVERFFNTGIFNENSNICFGEGGAGTFSDAKLTTRINHPNINYIIDKFIKHGAPQEIKYESHPHIGTDIIRNVIKDITDYLINEGVEFHFDEEVNDFIIEDNKISGVITDKNKYYSDYVLLGLGHNSRNTISKLIDHNVYIETKDTAIGFRVEHPQLLINKNQYNESYSLDLPASEYFLRHKDDRDVYSFCMCPGGYVIASNARRNSICTNGMSYHNRNNELSNSAILIQVKKESYGNNLLDGFNYLERYENNIYELSNSYKAIAMNIKDYIDNELNDLIFKSSYPLDTYLYNFNNIFNDEENRIFKNALKDFDKKIPGFINEGIMVGLETRASSPIRIKRNNEYESINTKGLYPMGEGAGYGGGIMSCGLDGIRISEEIIKRIINSH